MTTVKAHFDGRVFVPDEPVHLPVGFQLQISIETPAAERQGAVRRLFGAVASGNQFSADNERIDADLARAYEGSANEAR
jgi:hypothetical protein